MCENENSPTTRVWTSILFYTTQYIDRWNTHCQQSDSYFLYIKTSFENDWQLKMASKPWDESASRPPNLETSEDTKGVWLTRYFTATISSKQSLFNKLQRSKLVSTLIMWFLTSNYGKLYHSPNKVKLRKRHRIQRIVSWRRRWNSRQTLLSTVALSTSRSHRVRCHWSPGYTGTFRTTRSGQTWPTPTDIDWIRLEASVTW